MPSQMELTNSNLWEVGSNLSENASSTPAPEGLPPIFGVEVFLTANTTADAEISSQGLSEVSPDPSLSESTIYFYNNPSIIIFRNPIFGTLELFHHRLSLVLISLYMSIC